MNALALRILAGLIIGLGAGALLAAVQSPALPPLLAVAGPVGKLWLDALTMTVVPLLFGLLVTGVGAVAAEGAAGGVAARALAWFAVMLLGACAFSALMTSGLLALWPSPMQASAFHSDSPPPTVAPLGEWLSGLIPANPIKAAAETAVAPLVLFALVFGFAVTRIAEPLRRNLLTFFEAVVETMLVIVRWVLWLGPVGVAALAFRVGAQGGAGAFGALLHYVALVSLICALTGALAAVVAMVAGRIPPLAFVRAALPAQAVAMSTQSSLASLPAMIQAASGLGASEARAGVVLPLAVSLFRAASAAANVAVALYLAHLHGIAVGPLELAICVLVAAPVSLAAVGLPAQVSFFATIGPVALAIGAPLELLPILLAVETVPDIFRTIGNVTADLAVTRIVGRASNEKGAPADRRALVPDPEGP